VGAVEVELTNQRIHAALLIRGQLNGGQPATPDPTEEIAVGAGGRQVPRQDRMDLVFSRVRWRTRCVLRATRRRSIRVRSSAPHVSARKSAARSWARTRASTLSVLTFA